MLTTRSKAITHLLSTAIAGALGAFGVIAMQPNRGIVEADGFRLVQGDKVIWEVVPRAGTARMTFRVGNKEVITMWGTDKVSAIDIQSPDGDAGHQLLAFPERAQHTLKISNEMLHLAAAKDEDRIHASVWAVLDKGPSAIFEASKQTDGELVPDFSRLELRQRQTTIEMRSTSGAAIGKLDTGPTTVEARLRHGTLSVTERDGRKPPKTLKRRVGQ